MKKLIVTNNPMVRERYSQQYDLKYEETSFVGVLKQVRDLVHRGYRLLTHPLSGSIKPNETPYKSVLLEESTGKIEFLLVTNFLRKSIHIKKMSREIFNLLI